MNELEYLKALLIYSFGVAAVIVIAIAVVLYAKWCLFEKVGEKGWKALIPFYNSYIEYENFWGCGFFFLVPLFFSLFTPYDTIGLIFIFLNLVIEVLHLGKIAKSFNKSAWFVLGLVFLYPIFICILAFDKNAKYIGVVKDGYSYDEIVDRLSK